MNNMPQNIAIPINQMVIEDIDQKALKQINHIYEDNLENKFLIIKQQIKKEYEEQIKCQKLQKEYLLNQLPPQLLNLKVTDFLTKYKCSFQKALEGIQNKNIQLQGSAFKDYTKLSKLKNDAIHENEQMIKDQIQKEHTLKHTLKIPLKNAKKGKVQKVEKNATVEYSFPDAQQNQQQVVGNPQEKSQAQRVSQISAEYEEDSDLEKFFEPKFIPPNQFTRKQPQFKSMKQLTKQQQKKNGKENTKSKRNKAKEYSKMLKKRGSILKSYIKKKPINNQSKEWQN